jgi:hypothetical protein
LAEILALISQPAAAAAVVVAEKSQLEAVPKQTEEQQRTRPSSSYRSPAI